MLEEYTDNISNINNYFENGKYFKIMFDNCVNKLKIICRSYNSFKELQNVFSAPNPGSFFAKQYGYKVQNKIFNINKFGYFSSGLLFEILNWIKNQYGSLSVISISKNCKNYIDDFLTPLKKDILNYNLNYDTFDIANISDDSGRNNELLRNNKTPYLYRDYQENSIKNLIFKGYGRGLIEIPTAGGKSFILANFIWNLIKYFNKNFKFLILVPNKQLVSQFYKDLLDYGFLKEKITKFTAGLKKNELFNPDAQVIIGNRQFIFKNKNQLKNINVLIADEVHQYTDGASAEYIESLNCPIKIGCSGTIPRDKYKMHQLIGYFSKIVYKEDIVSLQKHGYISKLKITLLKIIDNVVQNDKNLLFNCSSNKKYRPDEFGYSDITFNEAYIAENEYFEKNYKDLYKPVFEYLFKLNENILILFDRINIGQNLFEIAKNIYNEKKKVFYIDGSIEVIDRENIRNNFEKEDGNLLIAQTATFATGINIKRLTHLVFLTSSKSFSRTIQSVGRTLRLHQLKKNAHLIDVSWNFKYSRKHLNERLQIYKQMYNKNPDEILTFELN